MDSKKIHYLSEDTRRSFESPQSRGLKHLAAAHEKLLILQAARKELKQQYANRVEALEVATGELEKNRAVIANQSELLKEYEAIIESQSGLIDRLREEKTELQARLVKRRPSRDPDDEAPSLTVRAVEKHEQKRTQRKEQSEKNSLSDKFHRLLK